MLLRLYREPDMTNMSMVLSVTNGNARVDVKSTINVPFSATFWEPFAQNLVSLMVLNWNTC